MRCTSQRKVGSMSAITTVNPATGEEIQTCTVMTEQEATDCVEACHAAFQEWRKLTHHERAPFMTRIGQTMRDHADELAALMTRETGKLLKDGHMEVELCAAICDYTAQHGPGALADEERSHGPDQKRGVVTYQPIGVIYSIQPWIFPFYQPIRVLAANLMAGNGCVLKHASICTGSGLRLRELCLQAGLPEDLFQVVMIDHDTSDTLIAHPKARAVTMTDSDQAGRHVGAIAAKALRKTVLELGSNDKVYDAFVDAFVAQMKAITMGDPTDASSQLGPLSSKAQFKMVKEQVDISVAKGATVLCGGKAPDRIGAYYPATFWPASLPACQPMTMKSLGWLLRSSGPRTTTMPCVWPMKAAMVWAAGSFPRTRIAPSSWPAITLTPAWSASTSSGPSIRICRLAGLRTLAMGASMAALASRNAST